MIHTLFLLPTEDSQFFHQEDIDEYRRQRRDGTRAADDPFPSAMELGNGKFHKRDKNLRGHEKEYAQCILDGTMLTSSEKQIIMMMVEDDFSETQISSTLGISVAKVRTVTEHAIQKMRSFAEGLGLSVS
jgi:DNA-directed RNA polymerase specialized sigma24 family protein